MLPFSSSSLPIKDTGKTWYWLSKRPSQGQTHCKQCETYIDLQREKPRCTKSVDTGVFIVGVLLHLSIPHSMYPQLKTCSLKCAWHTTSKESAWASHFLTSNLAPHLRDPRLRLALDLHQRARHQTWLRSLQGHPMVT